MAYNFSKPKSDLENISSWLKGEYKSIQTGRATPQVLDSIHIDLYGSRTPIAHAGSINIEDPKTLRVSPWDKGNISLIEKSINDADLGLSVSSDNEGLRIHFPHLTEESRLKMVKILKDRLEDARVKVRNVREEANKEIDSKAKEGEYGEDDRNRHRDEMQKMVDEANSNLLEIFSLKEKEVMDK